MKRNKNSSLRKTVKRQRSETAELEPGIGFTPDTRHTKLETDSRMQNGMVNCKEGIFSIDMANRSTPCNAILGRCQRNAAEEHEPGIGFTLATQHTKLETNMETRMVEGVDGIFPMDLKSRFQNSASNSGLNQDGGRKSEQYSNNGINECQIESSDDINCKCIYERQQKNYGNL